MSVQNMHYFHSSSDDLLWKVLIADEDQLMHQKMKKILSKQIYNHRGIRIFGTYSAEEVLAFLSRNPDTAVLFYSAALGADHPGSDIEFLVRQRLGNKKVSLIRLAGPSEVEIPVADEYETVPTACMVELESDGFSALMAFAIREYKQKTTMETIRSGLGLVLGSLGEFNLKSVQQFSSGILKQMLAFSGVREDAFYCRRNKGADGLLDFYIASATAGNSEHINKSITDVFEEPLLKEIEEVAIRKDSISVLNNMILCAHGSHSGNPEALLIIRDIGNRKAFNDDSFLLFIQKMASFFDMVNFRENLNACLNEAVLIVDRSNTVLYSNPCFDEAFGRFTDIRKGMRLERFLKELGRHTTKNEDNDYFISLLENPSSQNGAGELKLKSGGSRVFSFRISALTDMTGANAGKIVVFYDITDAETRIEHLQSECRALSKLNEKNEVIINNISNQTNAMVNESNRFAESILDICAGILRILADTAVYNGKIRKRIVDILEMIEHEKDNIGDFVSNIEQKQVEFKKAFKKLVSEAEAYKAHTMRETGLDEKEIVILRMIASLKSNKEIAKELNYEEETIKNKITLIRRKLKLKDRCHLVSFAFRNGLV